MTTDADYTVTADSYITDAPEDTDYTPDSYITEDATATATVEEGLENLKFPDEVDIEIDIDFEGPTEADEDATSTDDSGPDDLTITKPKIVNLWKPITETILLKNDSYFEDVYVNVSKDQKYYTVTLEYEVNVVCFFHLSPPWEFFIVLQE